MRLIDADELKKAVCKEFCGRNKSCVPDPCGNIEQVDSMPTIEAEPVRHGHWVIKKRHEHYPSGKEYEEDFCSACSMRGSIEYDYCPHCGAKMDEAFEWLD